MIGSRQDPAMSHEETHRSPDALTNGIVVLTICSALGGFLFGYDTGVVSGSMLLIRKEFELTIFWQELIISSTIAAAWLFSLIAGQTADYLGRKKVILVSSLVFTVGGLVMAFATNKETLLIGRIIVGVAIGLSSMCIPIYLSEVAPLSARGHLTVTNTLFITGGQFIASVFAGLLSGFAGGWRWMLGIGSIPAIVQFFAFIFAPESPRWLITQGRVDEARTVLQNYRSNLHSVEVEMKTYTSVSNTESYGMKKLFTNAPVRRALTLGCLLQLFQQIAGINTVMYYSASIIAMAGVNDDQLAIWLSAVTAFFNFSFTFVGLWLVERIGRRPLTLGSLFGVTLALFSLALSFQLVYINSSEVSNPFNETPCSEFNYCSSCTRSPDCGFCFFDAAGAVTNSSCLLANHTSYNQESTTGDCSSPVGATFAYDWCPSKYAWLSILGLCLYLCFFAPGMGPMPWSINSEIYPNWARAKGTSVATSVNWASNLLVSLTFLSLTEAITKHGTFYLYMVLALAGLVTFFFILPETKGIPLEDVEEIFRKPLFSSKPWKRKVEEEKTVSTTS